MKSGHVKMVYMILHLFEFLKNRIMKIRENNMLSLAMIAILKIFVILF